MENPLKIPTDNLYKFKAIAYLTLLVVFLILFIASIFYFLPKINEVEEGIKQLISMIFFSIFTTFLLFLANSTYKKVLDSFEEWHEKLQKYQDIIIKKEA